MRAIAVSVLLFAAAALAEDEPKPDRYLELALGQQAVIPIDDVRNTNNRNAAIANTKTVHGKTVVVGVGVGRTMIAFWDASRTRVIYQITVTKEAKPVPLTVTALQLKPGTSVTLEIAGLEKATPPDEKAIEATMPKPGFLTVTATDAGEATIELKLHNAPSKLSVKAAP